MALRPSTGLRTRMLGKNVELVSNGGFASATTDWTGQDATLSSVSGGQSGNCLQVAESGSSNAGIGYQAITTQANRVYYFEAYFKKGTSATGSIKVGTSIGNGAFFTQSGLSDANWTKYSGYFKATGTTTYINLITDDATAGETSLFDEVSMYAVDGDFRALMTGCFMNIYTGSQPSAADDPATGTLLCTIYSDGTSAGLNWDEASAGSISKAAAETWSGTAAASGTAGWFRIYEPGDDPTISSTAAVRMDGAIATSGVELNMSSTSIASGAVQTISTCTITFPTA